MMHLPSPYAPPRVTTPRIHNAYSLLLASLLGCTLLAGRIYLTHSLGYAHMLWNLLLAWIPYACSLWAVRVSRRRPGSLWPLLVPAALWLSFLPNAPYLLTEFVHLLHVPTDKLWYDVALLLAFGWTGCFLAVASLQAMQALIWRFVGAFGSWLFVAITALLCGLGVHLGRDLRWNSWDLLLNPAGIFADISTRVAHPLDHPRSYGVTLFYAAFLLVSYITVTVHRVQAGPD
jgi:uncharacterized membrane protein